MHASPSHEQSPHQHRRGVALDENLELGNHAEHEEEDEVFNMDVEVSALMSGRETPKPPAAIVLPQSTLEALPVKAESLHNQSRFAVQGQEEDRPMSTSELLAFIAQQRQG